MTRQTPPACCLPTTACCLPTTACSPGSSRAPTLAMASTSRERLSEAVACGLGCASISLVEERYTSQKCFRCHGQLQEVSVTHSLEKIQKSAAWVKRLDKLRFHSVGNGLRRWKQDAGSEWVGLSAAVEGRSSCCRSSFRFFVAPSAANDYQSRCRRPRWR